MRKKRVTKKSILALCLGAACSLSPVYAADVTLDPITVHETGTMIPLYGYQVPAGIAEIDITNSSITANVDNSAWSNSLSFANVCGLLNPAPAGVTLQGASGQTFPVIVSGKGGTSTAAGTLMNADAIALGVVPAAGTVTVNANMTVQATTDGGTAGSAASESRAYARALAYGIMGYPAIINGNATIQTTATGGIASTTDATDTHYELAFAYAQTYGIQVTSATINGNAVIRATATGGTAISHDTYPVPMSGGANAYAYAYGISVSGVDTTNISGNADMIVSATGGTATSASGESHAYATAGGIGNFSTGTTHIAGDANITVSATGGTASSAAATPSAYAIANGIINTGTTNISGDANITVTARAGSVPLVDVSAYGIYNYSGTVSLEKNAIITATATASEGHSYAYVSYASGGTININQEEGNPHTVKLIGDVLAEGGAINIALANGNSFLRGNVATANDAAVNFTLANNAVWQPVYDSRNGTIAYNSALYSTTANSISSLNLSGGIVDLTWDDSTRTAYRNLAITSLSGSGGTLKINTDVAGNTGDTVAIGALSSATNLKLAVTYDKSLSSVTQPTILYTSSPVYSPVSTTAAEYLTLTGVTTDSGAYSLTPVFSGTSLTSLSIGASSNTKAAAGAAGGQAALMQTSVNHLRKRLGDLRDDPAADGAWGRVYTGEVTNDKYSPVVSDYKGMQVGYDKSRQVLDGRMYTGGAFSYTKADNSFYRGGGDSNVRDVALYQTWLGKDGHYYDIVAKHGWLRSAYHVTDLNSISSTADYSTGTNSLSVEYGYRKQLTGGWYLEPQTELTFGHINSAHYTTSAGMNVKQDSITRLIGRIGLGAGKSFGGNQLYTSLSALHEFKGEQTIKANNLYYSQDMSGTWYEFILGATAKLSDHSNGYINLEKLFGGDVSSNWQLNAGCRWSF